MTNQISVFQFQSSYEVRIQLINNEPFFCLKDVCSVLDIKNHKDLLAKQIDNKGVEKIYLPTNGGNQYVVFINEPNLYRVIFRSNKKEAVDFQNWVFEEVLPTIRKTGSYSLTINSQQQQKIKQAVNERVYRTGEKHQAIYSKFHQQFKIPRYQDLPASNFDEAIKWLGGVHVKLSQFTNDELCTLAWCYKAAERMRQHIRLVTEAMYQIKSEYAPAFYSMGIEYKSTLENARIILDRETKHIDHRQRGYLSNNWNRVLPCIRHHNLIEAA
jgi:prophage antirepressor-like protein